MVWKDNFHTRLAFLCLGAWPAIAATGNSCLLRNGDALQPPSADAPTTFLSACPGFVIRSTDALWHQRGQENASLEKYFYEGFTSLSSFGQVSTGTATYFDYVQATKRAFPDLHIHVTDVFCTGNDVDGYKTTMPDVLTGTHLGWHPVYGAPTGRRFAYSGIAVCLVQRVRGRWQYISEWINHDEWALMVQLGVNISALPHPAPAAKPHDCRTNRPSWGWQPLDGSLAHGELQGDPQAEVEASVWNGHLALVFALYEKLVSSEVPISMTVLCTVSAFLAGVVIARVPCSRRDGLAIPLL